MESITSTYLPWSDEGLFIVVFSWRSKNKIIHSSNPILLSWF